MKLRINIKTLNITINCNPMSYDPLAFEVSPSSIPLDKLQSAFLPFPVAGMTKVTITALVLAQGLNINSQNDLLEIDGGALATTTILDLSSNAALATISGFNSLLLHDGDINIGGNASLANVTGFNALAVLAGDFQASGCALTAASVNHILAVLVAAMGGDEVTPWAASVDLSGGTSAAPSGQGILDVILLTGRGATVTTN